MRCVHRSDGHILDLRMIVEVCADKSAIEGSTEKSSSCRVNAKEAASLFDVAGKIA